MKKFSLLKYLNPYDSFSDLSGLEYNEAEKLDNMKNSKIYRNTSDSIEEMISSLQAIESAILRGDVTAIYALEDKDLHDIKRILKRLRKRYMELSQMRVSVSAKKYKNNYKS